LREIVRPTGHTGGFKRQHLLGVFTALFNLVSARYERGSIALTSSKGLVEWGDPCLPGHVPDHVLESPIAVEASR